MKEILLDNLTEYQKSLLTRLSYLDIDYDKFKELATQKTITISDLKDLILNPNEAYLGSLHIANSTRIIAGVCTTNIEFLEILENAGLGNLEIVDVSIDKNSGFNAICFKDAKENTGFSFRGTDVKSLASLIKDGLSDFEAFVLNHTEQVNQAQSFFEKHQNSNSQNFLYGHSLGGFLAENVYLNNIQNIANTFVMNPLHINSQLLTTEEQLKAFNDSDKFSCFVTGGDYVSEINSPIKFQNNIHYVRNNNQTANNVIGNHLIEAGELDEYGNFIQCSKEEAFKGHSTSIATTTIAIINNNKIKSFFSNKYLAAKVWLKSMKERLATLFKRDKTPEVLTRKTEIKEKISKFDDELKLENYVGKNYSEQDLENTKNAISHPGKTSVTPTTKFPKKDFQH